MLARVVRPDGKEVSFACDALDRRIRKSFAGTTTHFVWDGNVPLHEWTETADSEESVITWLFEQDTFVPAAKLVANGDCFSIVSDFLGTPLQAYDKQGYKVWEQKLDIYGRQRKRPSAFIPFLAKQECFWKTAVIIQHLALHVVNKSSRGGKGERGGFQCPCRNR